MDQECINILLKSQELRLINLQIFLKEKETFMNSLTVSQKETIDKWNFITNKIQLLEKNYDNQKEFINFSTKK